MQSAKDSAKMIIRAFEPKNELPWQENDDPYLAEIKTSLRRASFPEDIREDRRELKEDLCYCGEWMKRIANPFDHTVSRQEALEAARIASEALLSAVNHHYPRHSEGQQLHLFKVDIEEDGSLKFATNDRNNDINWPVICEKALAAVDGNLQQTHGAARHKGYRRR